MKQVNKIDYIHRIDLSVAIEINFLKYIYEKVVTKMCAVWFNVLSGYHSIYINMCTQTYMHTILEEYISQYSQRLFRNGRIIYITFILFFLPAKTCINYILV